MISTQTAGVRTAYDDFATAVCQCGTSFHCSTGDAMGRHELRHHAEGDRLTYAIFAAQSQDFVLTIVRTAA